jgi:hypothetical protein
MFRHGFVGSPSGRQRNVVKFQHIHLIAKLAAFSAA